MRYLGARRSWVALAVLAALIACGGRPSDRAAEHARLGGDVVARVADLDIPVASVAAVAAARRVSPMAAAALLVDDAVAAKGALVRGLGDAPGVRVAATRAKARATVDRLWAEATRAPPSDDEVRSLSALHWQEMDRPETVLVIHALALRPKKPDAAAEDAARALAAAIAAAEVGAADASEFEARAKAFPAGKVELKVERLDPVTADGRVAVPGPPSGYDPKFAAAAAALPAPGATSGVVETPFGFHVIRLLERRPAVVVPFEERRRALADETYALRARQALEALEAANRDRSPVELANGIDELLAEALPAAQAPGAPETAPGTP